MNKKLIIVLGMHRSGTSAITRGLLTMGVSLGENLMPPCKGDNEKGFWEDIDINALNIEMLNSIKSDWHCLAGIKPEEFDSIKQQGYSIRAEELIHGKTRNCSVFGFKDPRISRLLPFWKEVFSHCRFRVSYILAVRHPMSVVKSLAKRNGFDDEKSYLMWLGHVIHSLSGTLGCNRIVVDYDRVMQNPEGEMNRIAKRLKLKIVPGELETYKIDFLDNAMRHTTYDLNDLLLDEAAPPLVREVYSALSGLSETIKIDDEELSEKTAKWEDELVHINSALTLADRLYWQKINTEQLVKERDIQINSLNQQVAGQNQLIRQNEVELKENDLKIATLNQLSTESEHRNVSLNQLVTGQHSQIADLNQILTEKERKIAGLNQILTEHESQILRLNQTIIERENQITNLSQILTEQEQQIAKSDQILTDREGQITSLNKTLTKRKTQIENLDQTLTERKSQIAGLNQSITGQKKKITSLDQALSDQESQIAGLNQALTERESQIAGLNQALTERESQIAGLNQALTDRESHNAGLDQSITEQKRKITSLDQALSDQESQIAGLNQALTDQENQKKEELKLKSEELIQKSEELNRMNEQRKLLLSSKSWRITKPLRFIHSLFHSPFTGRTAKSSRVSTIRRSNRVLTLMRKVIWSILKNIYQLLPLPITAKKRLKLKLFSTCEKFLNVLTGSHFGYITNDEDFTLVAVKEENQAKIVNYIPWQENKPIINLPVKILAFYLPQFHAIPENDTWWCAGFTEWSNVKPAKAQFEGHYQPHIPGELGYYNLTDIKIQQRQVELAKNYGIAGFCFHFYWFNGKRLLEKPIENWLLNPQLDLPFCISWANENWTRCWDGRENEILIRQEHSPADDLAFIRYVSKYMQDSRYIRIGNKPLLIVYRPGLFPSVKETAERWRTCCRDNGIGEIYLAYVQSFDKFDPVEIGFDAAIEFPPNNFCPTTITHLVKPLDKTFKCNVYDWKSLAVSSEHYTLPGYKLFRGVCPGWDNTPRRKNESTIFINSHPDDFTDWVHNAAMDTIHRFDNPDERLVFVNAWNEWAEGAYLEPDQMYGYAWLDSVKQGIIKTRNEPDSHKIIIVSHDAHPHGAQFIALEMVRTLIHDLKIDVEVILLGSGILKEKFEELAQVHELSDQNCNDANVKELARKLSAKGYKKAIVNTVVSGWLIPIFDEEGIESICLVHELPGIIKSYKLENHVKAIASSAKKIVFPSQIVEKGFKKFSKFDDSKRVIKPQGLLHKNKWRFEKESARRMLREELGIDPQSKIVLSVGFADQRKGADLFIDMGLQILLSGTGVVFIWVGHIEQNMQKVIESKLDNNPYKKYFCFPGFKSDTGIYYAGSDVFALTAREDPFPSVIVESFDAGLPVVAFDGSGGGAELISQVGGITVPAEDTVKFASAVSHLMNDAVLHNKLGTEGQAYSEHNFSFRKYMFFLCGLLDIKLPKLSVIVPNFNYSEYIEERLNSIMNQSIPVYELIFLDDASTDQSKQNILRWLRETNCEINLKFSDTKSGSVLQQWIKGIDEATGDFVWIAEADDLSEPDFLENVLPLLMSDDVVLSYCESKQIDSSGKILANNYHVYLSDVSKERWNKNYIAEGVDEITSSLAVLNTIPNISAVVFRRNVLTSVIKDHFEEFMKFKKALDYIVYVRLLSKGKLAFSTNNANLHRRHSNSVIAKSDPLELYREIAEIQKIVKRDFGINENTRKLADEYLSVLRKQFDLMEA